MNLIMSNWQNILVVILSVAVLFVLYRQGKKKEVKQIILSLIKEADEAVDTTVLVDKVYDKLPSIVKLVVSKKKLGELVDEAIKEVEDGLNK